MWVAKFKGFDKDNIYNTKTRKYKINVYYYPINYYIEKDTYYFIAVGILEGSEKNKKEFFSALKKENKFSKEKRYVVKLEVKGNFFICITAQHKNIELERYVHLFYNPKFIHIKPALINSTGWEEWEIATLNKKDIEKLLEITEKKYQGKILSIKETKLSNIGILSVLPNLTEKQKRAFLLAVENGYYEYPRKIELKRLAKLMNKSLSTYQAHLRKAEKQLLLFTAQKYF